MGHLCLWRNCGLPADEDLPIREVSLCRDHWNMIGVAFQKDPHGQHWGEVEAGQRTMVPRQAAYSCPDCQSPTLLDIGSEVLACTAGACTYRASLGEHRGRVDRDAEEVLAARRTAYLRDERASRRGDQLGPVVYYLRFGDRIKIGTSTNLARRLQSVPCDEVMAVEPGGLALEGARHDKFAELRITGEWFRPGDALLDHVFDLRGRHAIPLPPGDKRVAIPA